MIFFHNSTVIWKVNYLAFPRDRILVRQIKTGCITEGSCLLDSRDILSCFYDMSVLRSNGFLPVPPSKYLFIIQMVMCGEKNIPCFYKSRKKWFLLIKIFPSKLYEKVMAFHGFQFSKDVEVFTSLIWASRE